MSSKDYKNSQGSMFANTGPRLKFFRSLILPRRNETSLYVMALAFLITSLCSKEFIEFANDSITSPDLEGQGFLIFFAFSVAVFIVILNVFLRKPIPGFRTFIAPFFILCTNSFLLFAYMDLFAEANSFLNGIALLYHSVIVLSVFILYKGDTAIADSISRDTKTPIRITLLASVVVLFVFVYYYFIVDSLAIWSIPITTSLVVWTWVELVLDRKKAITV